MTPGREVRARLVAAPLVLGVVLGVLWLHHARGFAFGTHALLAVFAAAGAAELALLFRGSGRSAVPLEAAVCAALLALSAMWARWLSIPPMTIRAVLLALCVLWVLLAHLRDVRPEAIESITSRLVPILYVGFLFSFMADLAFSAGLIAWVVIVAKASDMAGWAVGVPFGKHKMIPSVSPGKSWEGTVAGLVASALAAVLLHGPLVGEPMLETPSAVRLPLVGLAVGGAAILAGITWSGWKRRLGAKDSSALIPGLGGVMDMVDSLLLVGPAMYVLGTIL